MPFLPPLESIFKKNPISRWSELNPEVGDVFYALDGSLIRRGDKTLPALEFRPAILANSKVVVGDLIPSTSWGANLANMLTWESWDALRKPLIAKNNNVCELCGSKYKSLDVHEKWLYNAPLKEQVESAERERQTFFGTQVLYGLMTLCRHCHRCFHLGREKINGTLDESLERIAILNNWGAGEVREYYNMIGDRWTYNSAFKWRLDLRQINHPDGGVTIKKEWKLYKEGSRVLVAKTQWSDEHATILLNVPWRFEGESEFRKPNAP